MPFAPAGTASVSIIHDIVQLYRFRELCWMILLSAVMMIVMYSFRIVDPGIGLVDMVRPFPLTAFVAVLMYNLMFLLSLCVFCYTNWIRIIGIGNSFQWDPNPSTLDADITCPICMESMPLPTAVYGRCLAGSRLLSRLTVPSLRTLRCKHTFHSCCIEQWVVRSPSCPMCRCVVQRSYWVGCCLILGVLWLVL